MFSIVNLGYYLAIIIDIFIISLLAISHMEKALIKKNSIPQFLIFVCDHVDTTPEIPSFLSV